MHAAPLSVPPQLPRAKRSASWLRSVEGFVIFGFSLALALLAGIGLLSIKSETAMMKMVAWIDRTHEVMDMMKELELDVREAETALRSYILTGDQAERAEYQKQAFDEMQFHLRELRRLADSVEQRRLLDRIEPLLHQRVELFEQSREAFERTPGEAKLQAALNRSGTALTRQVLGVFGEFIIHERQRLATETAERELDAHLVIRTIWISGALGLGCSAVALYLVLHGLHQQRRVERELVASLGEQEILLKEVHHRVKNNLQVVSSLLSLQAEKFQDPAAVTVFKECRDRIHAMARLHQRLYSRGQFAWIEFEEHLREMAMMLVRSHAPPDCAVRLEFKTEPFQVDLDRAVTLSLIANELVINALKHAFTGRAAGTLTVALHASQTATLTVQDDGLGLPAGFDPKASAGLGLELVHGLCRQLQGRMQIQNEPVGGSSVTVTFPSETAIAEKKP